jgi:predicted MFS family arabinose efflux permease
VFAINVPLLAVTLYLIRTAVPEMPGRPGARVDVLGGVLCAAGLGGIVSGLIEREPLLAAAGAVVLAGFLWWERRAPQPMLPLGTFSSRTFAAGNATTFAVYAGLGAATFFIALFLQQVGGYSATEGGLSLLPISVAIVTLSRRAGALAERTGPRLLMGSGPLVAASGLLLLALRVDEHARYLADVLPGIALFGLGMAMTVTPLTAAVLGSVETGRAGVASGVNNAVARVASLVAIAGVGAIVAAQFGPGGPGRGFSATDAATSVDALHAGLFACAILMAAGGLIAFAGIEKGPRNA